MLCFESINKTKIEDRMISQGYARKFSTGEGSEKRFEHC